MQVSVGAILNEPQKARPERFELPSHPVRFVRGPLLTLLSPNLSPPAPGVKSVTVISAPEPTCTSNKFMTSVPAPVVIVMAETLPATVIVSESAPPSAVCELALIKLLTTIVSLPSPPNYAFVPARFHPRDCRFRHHH